MPDAFYSRVVCISRQDVKWCIQDSILALISFNVFINVLVKLKKYDYLIYLPICGWYKNWGYSKHYRDQYQDSGGYWQVRTMKLTRYFLQEKYKIFHLGKKNQRHDCKMGKTILDRITASRSREAIVPLYSVMVRI